MLWSNLNMELSNIQGFQLTFETGNHDWLPRVPETDCKILCINAYFSSVESTYFIIFSKVSVAQKRSRITILCIGNEMRYPNVSYFSKGQEICNTQTLLCNHSIHSRNTECLPCARHRMILNTLHLIIVCSTQFKILRKQDSLKHQTKKRMLTSASIISKQKVLQEIIIKTQRH